MRRLLVVVIALGAVALIIGGMYVSRRNQMVAKNQAVTAQWHQVDVVLERRADLIPNLVETVKGYAAQEKSVFDDVAKARSVLLSAQSPSERIAANARLDGALGRLLAISENYPQLKSNENFLRLQDELAGTENRIAVERRRYDDLIQDYNTYVEIFPNDIFAKWAGFQPNNAYFTASDTAREVPKVQFGAPSAGASGSSAAPAPAKQ